MKQRYRITPEGRGELSEAEIARHADAKGLLYNYQRAVRLVHERPLYRDPRLFLALLVIILLALLLSRELGDGSKAVPGSEDVEARP